MKNLEINIMEFQDKGVPGNRQQPSSLGMPRFGNVACQGRKTAGKFSGTLRHLASDFYELILQNAASINKRINTIINEV